MRCVVNVGYAEKEAVGTRRASRFDTHASVSPNDGVGCGIFAKTIVQMQMEDYLSDRSESVGDCRNRRWAWGREGGPKCIVVAFTIEVCHEWGKRWDCGHCCT